MKVAVAGATGLIGTKVVKLAESQGYEVIPISRKSGFDLVDSSGHEHLVEALRGVDAVIDVTQGADFDEAGAVAFFSAVGHNLGRAATEAGVKRTVLLSIVGIDRSPDYGYYVGKVAHEDAHRADAPGLVVVRATQFHDFPQQMIDWFSDGHRVEVMDAPSQPIETAEVVHTLLEAAEGKVGHDIQIAGPSVEELRELVTTIVQTRGDSLEVVAGETPASIASGSMVPTQADGVVIKGQDWHTWWQEGQKS